MTASQLVDRTRRAELARAARREEILAAARRVFANRGFRGTTIADIAEEANIALGTIYLYFSSKEAVFAALNQQLAELIAGAGNVPDARSLAHFVRGSVTRIFEACAANRDLVRLAVLNSDPESEVTKRIREADADRIRPIVAAIKGGIEAGTVRHLDAPVAGSLIQGLVSIAVYQAFVLSDGRNADRIRDECADMITAYLAPEGAGARRGTKKGAAT